VDPPAGGRACAAGARDLWEGWQAVSDERPEALLKSALDKIVYFEARAEQLHHELSATRQEVEHLKQELVAAGQRELGLRREVAELEVRLGRLGAEREELARLNHALRTERAQLLDKLLDSSRLRSASEVSEEDEPGIDLASFISQLRAEVLAHAGEGGGSRPEPLPPPVPEPQEQPALALATVGASVHSAVTRQAWRMQQEGRLTVSVGEESLFGFSVSELAAEDATSRIRAAERLRSLRQPAAAPALLSALQAEQEPTVQVALLQALAEVGREQGAAAVTPWVASPVPEVRMAALKALLTLAPEQAASHLAQAVSDPDRAVRRRASLLALGLAGEGSPHLGEQGLRDEEPEVRRLAALALGARRGEQARSLLLEALKDPEPGVRRAAAQSLSRIVGQDVTAVADMEEGRRRREVRRLSLLPVQPVRTTLPARPAAPVRASAPQVTRPRPEPSRVEQLCGVLLADIRAAIRGRTLGELVSGRALEAGLAEEAIGLLVARGVVVRRGHKYFAA
jgi:hypothetical protein